LAQAVKVGFFGSNFSVVSPIGLKLGPLIGLMRRISFFDREFLRNLKNCRFSAKFWNFFPVDVGQGTVAKILSVMGIGE